MNIQLGSKLRKELNEMALVNTLAILSCDSTKRVRRPLIATFS